MRLTGALLLLSKAQKITNEYPQYHKDRPNNYKFRISVKVPPEIPHQRNGYDCGVFMLQFMKYITMKKSFNFTTTEMSFFRDEMKKEISTKKIRPTL